MYSHKWCSRGRELPGVLIDVCRWHKRIERVRQKIGEGKGDTKGETVREEKSVYRRRKAGLPCLPLGFPLRRNPLAAELLLSLSGSNVNSDLSNYNPPKLISGKN
jgi:hypothetical protein